MHRVEGPLRLGLVGRAQVMQALVPVHRADCDTRTLGQQRCPDCNTFAHRLALGGHCPHCAEPVTVEELLQMPLDNT